MNDQVIGWVVFAGAWLLVGGPLYQAAIELSELEVDREGMEKLASQIPRTSMPSAWWWLLPPVMYFLARHRSQASQHYEWPAWMFWLLIVVMMAFAVLNTAVRMVSNERVLRSDASAAATPEAEPR